MPHSFTWEPHVATVRFTGFVSGAEFIAGARTLGADPRFDTLYYVVNDFSAVTDHAIDGPDILEELGAISLGSRWTNPRLRVLVVTTDERIRRFAEALSSAPYEETHAKHVFESCFELDEWLRAALSQPSTKLRGA
ncbi:MAG: hypothetical protein HY749_00385 [Gammaproteobacteria bacterium]|nr:hypothetical protein [Gammaproteobacteria bacterium]MBI5617105.1 hypothetical protein [Gammaproteobacteria bacterium]